MGLKNDVGMAFLLESARISTLFSRARFVYSVNAVNAFIAVLFLHDVVPAIPLLAWTLVVFGITAVRFRLLLDYERDESKESRLGYWKGVAMWGAALSGTVWGVAAVFLFPQTSLPHQIFLVVIIMGMMAGSVASWNAYFPAFQAYFLPAAFFVLMRFALEIAAGGEMQAMFVSLGAMFLLFTAGLYIFAQRSSQMLTQILQTRFEKAESDERYCALFHNAKVPMLLIDPSDGRIVDANTAAEGYYGYPEGRLAQMNIGQINRLSREEIAEKMANAKRLRESCFQFRHRLANGDVRDVEVYSGPVGMSNRELLYSIVHDITERKQMQQLLREREAHLYAILDNMPHMLWLKDRNGRYLAANRQLAVTAGLSGPEGVVGKTDLDLWPREMAEKFCSDDAEVMATRHQKFVEERALDNGREYWSETFKAPIIDEFGSVLGTAGYARDVTERKQAEEMQRLAASIYEASSEAIMVMDENDHIVQVNPAFTRITGYEPDDVLGRKPRVLNSERHDDEFYRQIWQAVLNDGHWQGEIWARRKNGELHAQRVSVSAIRHPDGSIYRYVSQFSDITERKQKDELIWRQANFDMLTNLPNRRLFRDRLENEIKKSRRTGLSLALLFIDLDRFKEINDTLGHDMGDRLLLEAALRISQCVRETDTVARLGGDEFTVILSEFGERQNIERIAQEIIGELCKPFMLGEEAAYISASVGITLFPEDAAQSENLLKNADQAMYVAKAQGRNRYAYFTEAMQREMQQKLSLTNDLRAALLRNELQVYYQPIVDVPTGRIVKAEALLRWKHGKRGMISPSDFIPLAEESGLIMEIGEWVFREAIFGIDRWRRKFGSIIPVSVNNSPVQFIKESSDREWTDRLVSFGLPGNCIAVEITERLLLKEQPLVRERLLSFRNGGIEVSIDDFGAGFSSLSYLKQFDIDYLKIDRSFISGLAECDSDKALVEAIIVMAHKLGIKTIAEGVETESQRDLLASFGCDFAQGFLYSRPVPEEEFELLLEKGVAA